MALLNKLKWKDKIVVGIIAVVLCVVFIQKIFFGYGDVANSKREIMVDGNKLIVEVVNTASTRYQGLSHHEKLKSNEGMLFLHDDLGRYEYVMRDMDFGLDFVFIRDGRIVDIAKNVSKNYKGVIKGATDYNKILEVLAGWVDENNIELGGVVMIK